GSDRYRCKPEQGGVAGADPALEMSPAFPYWPRCSSALRIGALETLIMPSSGWLISKIIKIAPETDRAQMRSTATTVALRGANMPKLTCKTVNQKSSTTRKGIGIGLCVCSTKSQRV